MILRQIEKPIKESAKLTVVEAARLMGKDPMWLRLMLRENRLPFGIGSLNKNGTRWNYYISPKKFTEYTGIKV